MPIINTANKRGTINEGINLNQGRDFSDLGAGNIYGYSFIDNKDFLQVSFSAGKTFLSRGWIFVKYNKNNEPFTGDNNDEGHWMKCELTANTIGDTLSGVGYLYIQVVAGLTDTGSTQFDGKDYFDIKFDTVMPTVGPHIGLLYKIDATAGTILEDYRKYRQAKFESIDIESDITFGGNVNIDGDLTVDGDIIFDGQDLGTYIDNQVTASAGVEALVDRDTYILGEDCIVNDSLFDEIAPTFAESTVVQNIGDVTANTRLSIIDFGSGVSGNTMQLALRKFGSSTANLSIRLETVDGSGNPTGTLVNANATATVLEASLSTSLVNTTVTFAGSFTIPIGQRYAIVLNQVGNVVNGTNFYGIGYVARDTTTRDARTRNGTAWSDQIGTLLGSATDNGGAFNSSSTVPQALGQRIIVNKNIFISQLNKSGTCTATRARIFLTGGGVLATATFSGNTATLSTPLYVTTGTSLRVEYDNNGANYIQQAHNSAPTFPAGTNISYISGSQNQSDTTQNHNITSIFSYEFNVSGFYYRASPLALPTLLSKTNAYYSYKLPTGFPRIANEIKTAGQAVVTTYYGLKGGFTGLSSATYYASNTPGLISTVAGSNHYAIGVGVDSTTLNIGGTGLSSTFTYYTSTQATNPGAPIRIMKSQTLSVSLYITYNTNENCSATLEFSTDGTNWTPVRTLSISLASGAGSQQDQFPYYISAGGYLRGNNTGVSAITKIAHQ